MSNQIIKKHPHGKELDVNKVLAVISEMKSQLGNGYMQLTPPIVPNESCYICTTAFSDTQEECYTILGSYKTACKLCFTNFILNSEAEKFLNELP